MLTIKSAEFIKSGTDETHYPDPLKTEYLLLGRSNVGKSSLINALLNRKNLARTSREPGKTVTLNFFLVNEAFYIVDAPGYGYARRSRTIIESFQKMITRFSTLFLHIKERALPRTTVCGRVLTMRRE